MPILNGSNDVRVTVTSSADTKGITQTQTALGGLSSEAQVGTKNAGGLSSAFDGFSKTVVAVGAALAVAKIGQYLSEFASNGLSAAAELQQTNQGFQTLIGNTEVANKLFGKLVQYANVTPFESKDITSAARTLLGFGQSAELTYDTIKKLGDVAGATGADFSSLALVTGQIYAQGTIHAQDFYQIINSGAGALGPLIAKNLGLDGVGGLKKAFEAGEVTSKSFFDALTNATKQGGFAFQGAEKQAQTFNGRLSTLKDAATQAGMAMLGVKVDPVLGYQVEKGGLFDKMSNGLVNASKGFTEIQPHIADFIDTVGMLFDKVSAFLSPSLEALWNTIQNKLLPAIEKNKDTIKLMAEVLGGALLIGLYTVINAFNIMANIVSFTGQVVGNVTDWFVDRYHNVANVWGQAVGLFQGIAGAIREAFHSAFNYVSDAWNHTVGKLNFKVPGWVPELGGKGWDVPDIPHFATGVRNFGGGLAVVGDVMGGSGEVVSLPKGSDVYTNAQSRDIMRGMGTASMTNNFTINNNADLDQALAVISWRLQAR